MSFPVVVLGLHPHLCNITLVVSFYDSLGWKEDVNLQMLDYSELSL